MDLPAYLQRIQFRANPRPDLETLKALHRQHLLHIPYENLDVQLGRRLDLDPAAAFDELVRRRRGGWCYEMNGVFAAALRQIGFRVTLLAGAVHRDARGAAAIGNHLMLRVDLDDPWLADVGYGDGLVEPVPLAEELMPRRAAPSAWRRVPTAGGACTITPQARAQLRLPARSGRRPRDARRSLRPSADLAGLDLRAEPDLPEAHP